MLQDKGQLRAAAALYRSLLTSQERKRTHTQSEGRHQGGRQATKGKGDEETSEGEWMQMGLVYEALGDSEQQLKRFQFALDAHNRALSVFQLLSAPASTLLALAASITVDLYQLGRFQDALEVVGKAKLFPGLSSQAAQVLSRLESSVHECKGDFASALHAFEAGRSSSEASVEQHLWHIHLLKMTIGHERMPATVRRAMSARLSEFTQQLLHQTTYRHADQLPKRFLPQIATPALPDVQAYPGLLRASTLLESHWQALRDEGLGLASQGLMLRDHECVHQPGQGSWTQHQVNAPWVELESGCSLHAPVACSLFRTLQSLGAIRASYSAVGANTWIRPHFGTTNGQLKLHLGLLVPGREDTQPPGDVHEQDNVTQQQACTAIRIANSTRTWSEGRTLLFDDSYEHEVWNRCAGKRVVFQVAFVHPLLWNGQVQISPAAFEER